jgi:hypothetical protein
MVERTDGLPEEGVDKLAREGGRVMGRAIAWINEWAKKQTNKQNE